jgi:hypothetical protein
MADATAGLSYRTKSRMLLGALLTVKRIESLKDHSKSFDTACLPRLCRFPIGIAATQQMFDDGSDRLSQACQLRSLG